MYFRHTEIDRRPLIGSVTCSENIQENTKYHMNNMDSIVENIWGL
jgi:hypothetical protein